MAKFNTDNLRLSSKRLQIEKSNTKVLIATSIAVVVLVFSLVIAQALVNKIKYQNKVIGLRGDAAKQLEKNLEATKELQTQYEAFDNSPESIIGNADPNTKVVLNALPSKYDFPALATSLENLLTSSDVGIVSITGTDNIVGAEQSSISPQPTEIPFVISAKGSYASLQTLVRNIERSTRPIVIKNISFKGADKDMTAEITAVTYYQPLKKLDLDKKVVPGDSKSKPTAKSSSNQKAAQ